MGPLELRFQILERHGCALFGGQDDSDKFDVGVRDVEVVFGLAPEGGSLIGLRAAGQRILRAVECGKSDCGDAGALHLGFNLEQIAGDRVEV